VDFDVDVTGLQQLWMLEQDAGSYDPARTTAGWVKAELYGPQGVKDVTEFMPAGLTRQAITANKQGVGEAITMPLGSRMVLPLDGKWVRIRGRVALDDRSTPDDIEGSVRFFIFAAEPDKERLVRVSGEAPEAIPARLASVNEAAERFYLQLFARRPNAEESRIVKSYFAGGKLSPAALEDLLWSLLLHPDFQYLY
jgi:hypothetical protein